MEDMRKASKSLLPPKQLDSAFTIAHAKQNYLSKREYKKILL